MSARCSMVRCGVSVPILASVKGRRPTGRIEFGTENQRRFPDIVISNCVFETSCGLALECVDGGMLEDIGIANITMRDLRTAPVFLRLGARLRGPPGTPIGTIKRVLIRGVVCHGPNSDMPSIICGIPGHAIEDVTISDIYVTKKGDGPADRSTPDPPERETAYPETDNVRPPACARVLHPPCPQYCNQQRGGGHNTARWPARIPAC